MAFLVTIADIKTHLYADVMDEITRSDSDIAQRAIDTAMDEAAGFMNRYDIDQLLGTSAVDPAVTDNNLKSKILDLVKWHLVRLGNPNIEYAAAYDEYKVAMEYFKGVQAGKINPRNWPYVDATTLPAAPDGLDVTWQSNTKRRNHFDD